MTIHNIDELLQAEQLIHEIEGDHRHPANDPRHPSHKSASDALRLLKSKATEARAELESRRYFLNKCY